MQKSQESIFQKEAAPFLNVSLQAVENHASFDEVGEMKREYRSRFGTEL